MKQQHNDMTILIQVDPYFQPSMNQQLNALIFCHSENDFSIYFIMIYFQYTLFVHIYLL